jgi:NCS1 family nucleobase:cation symporter-1
MLRSHLVRYSRQSPVVVDVLTSLDPIFGQLFGFPIANVSLGDQGQNADGSQFITTLFGMIVAASSENVYGKLIWNPLTYLDMILTDNYDAKTRAGCFFIGLGFAYSAMFSAIFENVLPAGNDISSLWPKYISMKRAFAICMIITVCICPWYLLGSAGIFISFIASYQVSSLNIVNQRTPLKPSRSSCSVSSASAS